MTRPRSSSVVNMSRSQPTPLTPPTESPVEVEKTPFVHARRASTAPPRHLHGASTRFRSVSDGFHASNSLKNYNFHAAFKDRGAKNYNFRSDVLRASARSTRDTRWRSAESDGMSAQGAARSECAQDAEAQIAAGRHRRCAARSPPYHADRRGQDEGPRAFGRCAPHPPLRCRRSSSAASSWSRRRRRWLFWATAPGCPKRRYTSAATVR